MAKKYPKLSGFTIIEVLIVLTIAALILLIIFLAVPAMQRAARNHSRKVDAGALAAAAASFSDDFNGAIPNTIRTNHNTDGSLDSTTFDLGYAPTCYQTAVNYNSVKMGYYFVGGDANWGKDAGDDAGGPIYSGVIISCDAVTSLVTPSVVAPDYGASDLDLNHINTENLSIIFGESCNSNFNSAGQLDSKAFAVFYVLETGSGNGGLRCLD